MLITDTSTVYTVHHTKHIKSTAPLEMEAPQFTADGTNPLQALCYNGSRDSDLLKSFRKFGCIWNHTAIRDIWGALITLRVSPWATQANHLCGGWCPTGGQICWSKWYHRPTINKIRRQAVHQLVYFQNTVNGEVVSRMTKISGDQTTIVIKQRGICGGQSGIRPKFFPQYFGFPP